MDPKRLAELWVHTQFLLQQGRSVEEIEGMLARGDGVSYAQLQEFANAPANQELIQGAQRQIVPQNRPSFYRTRMGPIPVGELATLAVTGAHGATAGSIDEMLTPFGLNEPFDDALREAHETRPILSTMGEIGGAAVPWLALGLGSGGGARAALASKAPQLAERAAAVGAKYPKTLNLLRKLNPFPFERSGRIGPVLGRGGAMGAAQGATYGAFAGGEEDTAPRRQNALAHAIFGGAAGVLGTGVGRFGKAAWNKFFNPATKGLGRGERAANLLRKFSTDGEENTADFANNQFLRIDQANSELDELARNYVGGPAQVLTPQLDEVLLDIYNNPNLRGGMTPTLRTYGRYLTRRREAPELNPTPKQLQTLSHKLSQNSDTWPLAIELRRALRAHGLTETSSGITDPRFISLLLQASQDLAEFNDVAAQVTPRFSRMLTNFRENLARQANDMPTVQLKPTETPTMQQWEELSSALRARPETVKYGDAVEGVLKMVHETPDVTISDAVQATGKFDPRLFDEFLLNLGGDADTARTLNSVSAQLGRGVRERLRTRPADPQFNDIFQLWRNMKGESDVGAGHLRSSLQTALGHRAPRFANYAQVVDDAQAAIDASALGRKNYARSKQTLDTLRRDMTEPEQKAFEIGQLSKILYELEQRTDNASTLYRRFVNAGSSTDKAIKHLFPNDEAYNSWKLAINKANTDYELFELSRTLFVYSAATAASAQGVFLGLRLTR